MPRRARNKKIRLVKTIHLDEVYTNSLGLRFWGPGWVFENESFIESNGFDFVEYKLSKFYVTKEWDEWPMTYQRPLDILNVG